MKKVRPLRGRTKGRGKGWKKGLAPKAKIREELGISRHESYSWQELARIPEDVFNEWLEKVRTREENGTVAAALRYAADASARRLEQLRKRAIENEEEGMENRRY